MIASSATVVRAAGTAGTETISFGDEQSSVIAWSIGRLSQEGKVSCVLFGQFSQAPSPPAESWIFIGRNILQDINTVDRREEESSLREATPVSKITSSENDLYEQGMDSCRADRVRVEVMKTQATLPKGGVIKDAAAAAPILRVSGCSLVGVNGRYIEGGYSNGCMRFRNVKGWVIFRQALQEIPELGIYADSCYDAFKGPSMRDLLDKRAGASVLLAYIVYGSLRYSFCLN